MVPFELTADFIGLQNTAHKLLELAQESIIDRRSIRSATENCTTRSSHFFTITGIRLLESRAIDLP